MTIIKKLYILSRKEFWFGEITLKIDKVMILCLSENILKDLGLNTLPSALGGQAECLQGSLFISNPKPE